MEPRVNELYDDLPSEPDEIVARIFDRRGSRPVWCASTLSCETLRRSINRRSSVWVVTRHADAGLVAREKSLIKDERLVDQLGSDARGPFASVMKHMMNFMAPPRHTRLRHSSIEASCSAP